MVAILQFIYLVLDFLLSAVVWIVIANAILSWLIAFQVVNMRNRTVYSIARGLDRAVAPMLRPLRFIPTLGGLDFRPVILIVVIVAAQRTLLPALFAWLESLAAS